MYYLNLIINHIDDKYKLKLIQKSFTNDIDTEGTVFSDMIKSSNKFSVIEMKGIYQDIVEMFKKMLVPSQLKHIEYYEGIVKKNMYIEFKCDDDLIDIIGRKLERLFDKYQMLHEYIEIPMESETTEDSDDSDGSEEGDFQY